MHGNPGCGRPVCMKVTAGSWLIGSECSERMTHSSSAIVARCGSTSVISLPLLPLLPDLHGVETVVDLLWLHVMRVTRCSPRTDFGMSLPCNSWSFGLGSNRSTCDGPPAMNR